MNSGEKEARERINNFKSIKVLYGKIYAMHKEQLEQLQKDIETALNLIEKQQREKELHIKLEQQYKKEYLDAKSDVLCETCNQKALDNTIKADRENFEKDKIIDLMARQIKLAEKGAIYNLNLCMGCQYMHCTSIGEFCTNNKKEHCNDCIEQYKEYFKKKVETEEK